VAEKQQLDIEQAINAAIRERAALQAANSEQLANQVQLAIDLCKSLKCEDLEEVGDRLSSMRESLHSVADGAGAVSKQTGVMAKGLKGNNDRLKEMGKTGKPMLDKKRGWMILGFVALKNKIQSAWMAMKRMGKAVMSAYNLYAKLKDAILSIPYKIMDNLRDAARGAGNAGIGIKNAYEDIKESFGSLESNEGLALKKGFDELTKGGDILGGAGVNLASVFGRGPEGVAAAMGEYLKLTQGMGPTITQLGDGMAKHAKQILGIGKALSLTQDDYKAMADQAVITGVSMKKVMVAHAKQAVSMSKQVGVSAKVISKNLMFMKKNYSSFGHLSKKELMATAAYASKLGIEMKTLQDIGKKFDDFESAAQSVSALSQAFGVQLDAVEMLNATEGERMSMLKEGLESAGQNWADLSKQEKQYMAESVGISSIEDLGKALEGDVSYDDMLDGADAAANATLSEADAMKALTKEIKLMHQTASSASKSGKGLWGTFFAGIEHGFMNSKFMLDLFAQIDKAFTGIFNVGKELGKFFGDLFKAKGPLEDVGKAIMALFDADRYIQKFKDISAAVQKFIKALFAIDPSVEGGVAAQAQGLAENLVKSLLGTFDVFEDEQGSLMKNLWLKVKKYLPYIGGALLGVFTGLADYAIEGLNSMAASLMEPSSTASAEEGVTDGIGTMLWNGLKAAWDAVFGPKGKVWGLMTSIGTVFAAAIKWVAKGIATWAKGFGKSAAKDKKSETEVKTGFFTLLWNALTNVFDSLFGPSGAIWALTGALGDAFVAIWEWLGEQWPIWWESIKTAATNLFDKLYTWIKEDGVALLTDAVNALFGSSSDEETTTAWWDEMKKGLSATWDKIETWWAESEQVEKLKLALGAAWTKIKDKSQEIWDEYIEPAIMDAWAYVKDQGKKMWECLKEALDDMWEEFKKEHPVMAGALQGLLLVAVLVAAAVVITLAVVGAVLLGFIAVLALVGYALWQVFKVVFMVLSGIWKVFKWVFGLIWDIVEPVIFGFVKLLVWAWDNVISPILDGLWTAFKFVFGAIWDTVSWVAGAIWTVIKFVFTSIWDTVTWVFSAIWTTLKWVWTKVKNIGKKIKKAWKALRKTAKRITKKISDAWDTMGAAISDAFDAITDKLGEWKEGVEEKIDNLKENLDTKWESIVTSFTDIMNGIGQWWEDHMSKKAWEDRFNAINTAWDNFKTDIATKVEAVFGPIAEKVRTAFAPITDALVGFIGSTEEGTGILGTIGKIGDAVETGFTTMIEGIETLFTIAYWRDTVFKPMLCAFDSIMESIKTNFKSFFSYTKLKDMVWEALKSSSPSKLMTDAFATASDGMDKGLKPGFDNMGKNLDNMQKSVGLAGKKMKTAGQKMTLGLEGPGARGAALVTEVANMIKEVSELDSVLQEVEDIDIVARLQKVADAYAMGPTSVSVNHKNVEITINLQVDLDAEDFARVLVDEKKWVGPGENAIPDDG
jgi:phage-related protein